MKKITEEELDLIEFVFNPANDTIDPQQYSWGGCLFETYGDDLAYVISVAKSEPERVVTILDSEDDDMVVATGYHIVNRQGYLITQLPQEEWHCVIDFN